MTYKTNSKIVKESVQKHILDTYDERGVVGVVEDMRAAARGEYGMSAARHLVEDGNFLISYYDQRQFLKDTLDQTSEQADKYSDDQVFRTYVELLAREILAMHDNYMYSPALDEEA